MIPVQNVYYMLTYVFQCLNEDGFKNVAVEQFDNVAELCAAILVKGVSLQLKQGLAREYISETGALAGIRGRIDITESIKTRTMLRKRMVCTYDEFSVNTYMNRIIKTTMLQLLHADVGKSRKKEIRRLARASKGLKRHPCTRWRRAATCPTLRGQPMTPCIRWCWTIPTGHR